MLESMNISGSALEIVLMVLLVATTFYAFRLERALGVLRRDRASLKTLVSGFSDSMQQAEDGIERLRGAADDAGRQIARHVDQARNLKSDLEFLIARGEKTADRLESTMSQPKVPEPAATAAAPWAPTPPLSLTSKVIAADPDTRPRSQAERDLLMALRAVR